MNFLTALLKKKITLLISIQYSKFDTSLTRREAKLIYFRSASLIRSFITRSWMNFYLEIKGIKRDSG